jgi:hypothetical protein
VAPLLLLTATTIKSFTHTGGHNMSNTIDNTNKNTSSHSPTSQLSPKEIFESNELTEAEKIKWLKQCEYHARQLAVAEDENMDGPQANDLPTIIDYLHHLGADTDDSGNTPTMLGA